MSQNVYIDNSNYNQYNYIINNNTKLYQCKVNNQKSINSIIKEGDLVSNICNVVKIGRRRLRKESILRKLQWLWYVCLQQELLHHAVAAKSLMRQMIRRSRLYHNYLHGMVLRLKAKEAKTVRP